METDVKELLKSYQVKNEASFEFIQCAIDVMNSLLNRNFESYMVGSSIRNIYLNNEVKFIEIVTSAKVEDLKVVFPAIVINQKNKVYLKQKNGIIYFSFFEEEVKELSRKNADKYYNKKLTKVLQNKIFTVDALALPLSLQTINIFNGLEDLDEMLIRTIDKPKAVFSKNPILIMDALILVSEYGFKIETKTLKALIKCCGHIEDIKEELFIKKLRLILKGKCALNALKLIVKYRLFKFTHIYDIFIKKIYDDFNSFTFIEVISILYLLLGKIPDASSIDKRELKEITETMTIAQLVASDPVTSMMVYNIGVDKLLSANKIALHYKHKYVNQEKRIKQLKKKSIISNIRELNFSRLELIEILNGERSIKVKLIMNLLLEKVINGEVYNANVILKEEAKKIIEELNEIFDYKAPEIIPNYTDEYIESLQKKYEKEFKFLVKVYLSDEKELYNLSALERDEFVNDASRHAKEFLLETPQYKILEERGLI